jgi:DNA-binding HxlR family transcriptional regulator
MRRKPGNLLPGEADVLRYAANNQAGFYGWQLSSQLPTVPRATVYRTLSRLQSSGLLVSEWQPSSTPGVPMRHVYKLTDLGQQAINTVVLVPVSTPWSGALGARAV